MDLSTVRPILDVVLIRVGERDEYSASGRLLLPDSRKGRPNKAEVVRCGPGRRLRTGARAEPRVKAGDHVLFDPYRLLWVEGQQKPVGTPFADSGQLALIRECDLLAVMLGTK